MSLAALLSGRPAPLLQNCRFEGGGVRAYGREEIAELFAGRDASEEPPRLLSGATLSMAIVGKGETACALVAETHGAWIGRLWYCGGWPLAVPALAGVDVPFDSDLDQRGGAVAFDPRDHATLAPADVAAVREAAHAYLGGRGEDGLDRRRPFVLRAFSTPAGIGMLVAVHGMTGGDRPRPAGYSVAILIDRAGGATAVADRAGLAHAAGSRWNPTL